MDCPPTPPACTQAWSSVGIAMDVLADWPAWTFSLTCSTSYELPDVACDVEHASLWAVVSDGLGDPWAWDWRPLLIGLYLPADGSGFVEAPPIALDVHLRDWALDGDHMSVVAAAGVNVDGEAIALTCPAELVPPIGLGFEVHGPVFGWPPDLDGNGIIGLGDLMLLLEQWGAPWEILDLLDLLLQWGQTSPWT